MRTCTLLSGGLRSPRHLAATALGALATAGTLAGATPAAAATTGPGSRATARAASSSVPPPSSDRFYQASGPLTAVAPGTVLKTRTVTVAELGASLPLTATQVLYRTTDQLGRPALTVATVMRPLLAATTRLVSYQMAYDGLGSQCDPSFAMRGGSPTESTNALEEQAVLAYLQGGYTVVTPDYEGTDLAWLSGQQEGYETLDGIRATEQALGLPAPSTPVGLIGYSGGSVATEFAAELAPRYAPRVDVVGAAFGGVPVDLAHMIRYVNGVSDWGGIIPGVIAGVARGFKLNLAPYLSTYGAKVMSAVSGECIDTFRSDYPGLRYQQLLASGHQDLFAIPAVAKALNRVTMGGSGTPRGPLLMAGGNSDGTGDGVTIPGDLERLAHDDCRRGTPVEFAEYQGMNHDASIAEFESSAYGFLSNRLAGQPVTTNCASIGSGNSLAPLPVLATRSPAPARLHLRSLGVDRRLRGLVVRVWSTGGVLRGLSLTLRRGHRIRARARVARVTASARRIVLRVHGRAPSRGRYTLLAAVPGQRSISRTLMIR